MPNHCWLSDRQFARLQPLLPTKVRGVPRSGRPAGDLGDPARLTERVSVARCAGRLWPLQDAVQPVRALGAPRGLGAGVCGTGGGWGARRSPCCWIPRRSRCSGQRRAEKGGRSTRPLAARGGGRTTKVHAAVDEAGRPRRLLVRPGHQGDVPVAPALVAALTPQRCLADTAYDSDAFRAWLGRRGCQPIIPNNPTRKRLHPFDPVAYQERNVIERPFCRLKDWAARGHPLRQARPALPRHRHPRRHLPLLVMSPDPSPTDPPRDGTGQFPRFTPRPPRHPRPWRDR